MEVLLIGTIVALIALRARHFKPMGIPALTSLRAFAAAMVFFLHFGDVYYTGRSNPLSDLMQGGVEGVTIFFVLSGFLLTLSTVEAIGQSKFQLRKYVIKRIARIYPLYYVLLLITTVLAPATVAWQHFVLAQGFFIRVVTRGIPTAWTLTVEECFYALLPIILWTCIKIRLSKVIIVVVWCAALAGVGLLLVALHIPEFLTDPIFMWTHSIFGRFPAFAIGIVCAFAYRNRQEWPLSLLVGSTIAFLITLHFFVASGEELAPGALDLACAVCIGGMVLGLTGKNKVCRFLGNRYFVYTGVISYALYLVQLTPIMERPANLAGASLVGAIAVYAIASFAAFILYETIEQPARALILRRTKHWQVRQVAV